MIGTRRHVVIASLPAALVGLFQLGGRLQGVAVTGDTVAWPLMLLARIGLAAEPASLAVNFVAGMLFWLPLLAVALATSFAWSLIFARGRGMATDPVWLPAGWLFALLMPPSLAPGLVVLALSFGLVFGCHAFGGTGRYLVSPVVLAAVFVAIGYPAAVAPDAWLPGTGTATTWSLLAGRGADATGVSLIGALAGTETGATGAGATLACLVGGAYLCFVARTALPVMLGGITGLAIGAAAFGTIPWLWQLAVGNFAFTLAFLATDPTTRARSALAACLFGALFGLLTITLRTANPEHPESSVAALLLASLCVPFLDHVLAALRRTRGSASHA